MKNIYIKRIVSAVLVVAITATLPAFDGSGFWASITGNTEVYAASSTVKQKAEAEKKKAEEEKKKAEEEKKKAEEEKKQAEQDKKDAEQAAQQAGSQVDKLEDKIETTQENIDYTVKKVNKVVAEQKELNAKIETKQGEIEQCSNDLAAAKDAVDEEYEAMKLRIQFMYENSATGSVWMAILGSNGIIDMLNRIEYVSDVYAADRNLMENYEEKVADVEELSAKLDADMEELLALQEENQKKKEELDEALAYLNTIKDKFSTQLAAAKADASAAQSAIAAAENSAKSAEQAAKDAAQAASDAQKNIDKQAEIIRQQEALAAGANSSDYEGGGTGAAGVSSNVAYLNDLANNPEPNPNVSGEEIVAFAKQFVGRPYKWGGNSLTNGTDCSGFVHLVYAHFGISTPRYSQAFKSWGKPVAIANVQPGDVVVYPGHVAIYAGNGVIVEAQSTKAGITCNRKFICHKVTGLRRYSK